MLPDNTSTPQRCNPDSNREASSENNGFQDRRATGPLTCSIIVNGDARIRTWVSPMTTASKAVPFDCSGTSPYLSRRRDSNPYSDGYRPSALPVMLQRHLNGHVGTRTPCLRIASAMFYQVNYTPIIFL